MRGMQAVTWLKALAREKRERDVADTDRSAISLREVTAMPHIIARLPSSLLCSLFRSELGGMLLSLSYLSLGRYYPSHRSPISLSSLPVLALSVLLTDGLSNQ